VRIALYLKALQERLIGPPKEDVIVLEVGTKLTDLDRALVVQDDKCTLDVISGYAHGDLPSLFGRLRSISARQYTLAWVRRRMLTWNGKYRFGRPNP
jgi:hypothetical protein